MPDIDARGLTAGEIQILESIFGIGYYNWSLIKIHNHAGRVDQPVSTVTTIGNNIYYPEGNTSYTSDISNALDWHYDQQHAVALLIHEVTHSIQYASGTIAAQDDFHGKKTYNYSDIFNGVPFYKLHPEAQAEFLRDLYLKRIGVAIDRHKVVNGVDYGTVVDRNHEQYESVVPLDLPYLIIGPFRTDKIFNSLNATNLERKIIIDASAKLEHTKSKFDDAEEQPSPLVLDLNGNGIELTSLSGNDAVYWDHGNDGFAEASGWVGPNDGILAYDLNNDGIINNGSELFGDQTGYANGFLALAQYDTNSDGQITSADTSFSNFRVWIDANQNGYSEANELHTLASLNITALSIGYSNVSQPNAGNTIKQLGSFTMNGTSHIMADVYFAVDRVNTLYDREVTLDPDVEFLPSLRGYGHIKPLYIAMSEDATLKSKVAEVAQADIATLLDPYFNLEQKITDIMYRWAGVDGVSPTSRGINIDARVVTFLEKLLDNSFAQGAGSNTLPTPAATADLVEAFGIIHDAVLGRLLYQSSLIDLFLQVPSFVPIEDTFNGSYVFGEDAIEELLDGAALDDQFYAWSSIFKLIDYTVGLDSLTVGEIDAINDLIELYDTTNTLDYTFMSANFEYIFGTAINGTNSADTITFNLPAGATIYGLGGNDTLTGNVGDDVLVGGAGNDTMNGGDGDDTFVVGYNEGSDIINGGNGTDTLAVTVAPGYAVTFAAATLNSVEVLKVTGLTAAITFTAAQLAGFTSIIHTAGASTAINITANAVGTYDLSGLATVVGRITLNLANGVNTVTGSIGNDTINGYNYADTIYGGAGNDTLNGGQGNDILYGGDGDDIITGGMGIDQTYGGDGNDTFIHDGYIVSGEIVDGGDGIDTLVMSNTQTLNGVTISNMEILSVLGNNALIYLSASALSAFSSIVAANGPSTALTIIGTAAGTYSLAGKTISGVVTLSGSSGADTLIGTSGNDIIVGNAGADTIYAGDGDDIIRVSGSDADYVDGGAGNDTIVAIANNNDIVLSGFTGIETISSGGFTGIDIRGSASADTLDFTGVTLSGIVSIAGGYGNDIIIGSSGNDTIYGEGDNDIINGGAGNDTLSGGLGADTFVFNATGNGVDIITDFINGTDKIDLRALGINFASLTVTTVGTAVKIVKTGSADIDITLNNFSAANVDASDFIFV